MALDMYETLILLNEDDSSFIKKYSPRVMFVFLVIMVLALFLFPFIHVPVGDELRSFTYIGFVVRVVEIGATSQMELFSLISPPIVMIITLAIIFKELKEDRLISPGAGFLLSAVSLILYFMLTYFSNIHNPFAIDRFILELDHNFQEDALKYVVYGAGYSSTLIFISFAILFFNASFLSELLNVERWKDRKIVTDHQKKVKREKSLFFQNSDNARRYTSTIRNKGRVPAYDDLLSDPYRTKRNERADDIANDYELKKD